jgi:hypothetical protein
VRFEVLTVVKMSTLVFCVVTPCGLVGIYQSLREIYSLHVRFQVLMVASMKMAVFWVVVPCSLVEV